MTTRQEVRKSLVDQGYRDAFSSPGRPELWIGPKGDRKATARDWATGEWVIVPYPEPAVCGISESSALEARDGIVLQSGKDPILTVELTNEETDWLDPSDGAA